MNINDVQKPNNEQNVKNNKVVNIHSYAAKNSSGNDFSYYVEVSKSREIKEQIQNKDNQNGETAPEDEILQLTEENENIPIAYVQTFNNLNNEIFDMGISDENQNKFSDNDIFKYRFDMSDITMNDIKLFEGLSQKSDIVINSVDTQNQNFNMMINGENLNISYRSLEVSKTLFSALEQASKTGKSVRLDFGQDTSVILRIGKDGKLSADFVPNEKAMEAVLKNALPQLKAKFEEQNLPYGELNYRSYNGQKNNQKEDNKEKKDE
ncbi:MAG: hypothetical protein K6A44_05265 [bacterium]|nr:hypothetical protein [bacterium]